MKLLLTAMFNRLDAWLARSALKAYEIWAREQCEQNAREREAIRGYFDRHYPSPSGRGWSRHE
jgi:hypothetical protein